MIRHLPTFLSACCLLLCCAENPLSAQQTTYTDFYRSNWQSVNPAALDRSYYLKKNHHTTIVNIGSRLQWIGVDGAPFNYFVSAEHCPQLNENEANNRFGFTAYGDQTDAIKTSGVYGNYSYFFPLRNGHVLHFGISPGVVFYGVDVSKLRGLNKDGNPTAGGADQVAAANKQRVFADFAFGMMYRIRKEFYFGLSVPQTFGLNLKKTNDKGVFETDLVQHLNLQVGGFIGRRYDISIDAYSLVYEPSAIMRIAPGVTFNSLFPSFFSMDANLRVHLFRHAGGRGNEAKSVYGGIGGSTNGTFKGEIGFGRPVGEGARVLVGMTYGVPVLQRYLSLGHSVEVNLSYLFL